MTLRRLNLFVNFCLLPALVLAGCSNGQSTRPPVQVDKLPATASQKNDAYYLPRAGGDPRSIGYWLLWNSCEEGNQAATAKANGGREVGWIILDDLLADPGVLIGNLSVESCEASIFILKGIDQLGTDKSGDVAYELARQLLAAQLNLAVGSEYCQASDDAVGEAQFILLGLEFDGTGSYLGPPKASPHLEEALKLIELLAEYNSGTLCQ